MASNEMQPLDFIGNRVKKVEDAPRDSSLEPLFINRTWTSAAVTALENQDGREFLGVAL